MKRIYSIDFARGIVIVIMALDHVRELLHTTALTNNPLDLGTTTPALYFTRWITHLCAPTFVFLAGTSAYLTFRNQGNLSRTRRFLYTRGFWLILLEFTVIGFAIWFDILFRTIMFQVIFAIGISFVILSLLLKIPARMIGLVGLCIIILHNLLPVVSLQSKPIARFAWSLLFSPGIFNVTEHLTLFVAYPVVSWMGMLFLGFGFGQVFELPDEKRRKIIFLSGFVCLVLFIILRTLNFYGDPVQWSPQETTFKTFLSFINITKYPPSLLFTAITLSFTFFLLGFSDGVQSRLTKFFITYGRVPLFFYILHWYLIHLSMFVMLVLQGVKWKDMPIGPLSFGRPATGVGLELPFIYVYWLSLVIFLYPLCKWYGAYKARHRDIQWLSYL